MAAGYIDVDNTATPPPQFSWIEIVLSIHQMSLITT